MLPFIVTALGAMAGRAHAALVVGDKFTGGIATYYGDGGADPAPIKPNYGACGFDAPADV